MRFCLRLSQLLFSLILLICARSGAAPDRSFSEIRRLLFESNTEGALKLIDDTPKEHLKEKDIFNLMDYACALKNEKVCALLTAHGLQISLIPSDDDLIVKLIYETFRDDYGNQSEIRKRFREFSVVVKARGHDKALKSPAITTAAIVADPALFIANFTSGIEPAEVTVPSGPPSNYSHLQLSPGPLALTYKRTEVLEKFIENAHPEKYLAVKEQTVYDLFRMDADDLAARFALRFPEILSTGLAEESLRSGKPNVFLQFFQKKPDIANSTYVYQMLFSQFPKAGDVADQVFDRFPDLLPQCRKEKGSRCAVWTRDQLEHLLRHKIYEFNAGDNSGVVLPYAVHVFSENKTALINYVESFSKNGQKLISNTPEEIFIELLDDKYRDARDVFLTKELKLSTDPKLNGELFRLDESGEDPLKADLMFALGAIAESFQNVFPSASHIEDFKRHGYVLNGQTLLRAMGTNSHDDLIAYLIRSGIDLNIPSNFRVQKYGNPSAEQSSTGTYLTVFNAYKEFLRIEPKTLETENFSLSYEEFLKGHPEVISCERDIQTILTHPLNPERNQLLKILVTHLPGDQKETCVAQLLKIVRKNLGQSNYPYSNGVIELILAQFFDAKSYAELYSEAASVDSLYVAKTLLERKESWARPTHVRTYGGKSVMFEEIRQGLKVDMESLTGVLTRGPDGNGYFDANSVVQPIEEMIQADKDSYTLNICEQSPETGETFYEAITRLELQAIKAANDAKQDSYYIRGQFGNLKKYVLERISTNLSCKN